MGADYNYYWDFSKEIKFSFVQTFHEGAIYRYKAEFEVEEGNYVIFKTMSGSRILMEKLLLDGKELTSGNTPSSVSYVAPMTSRLGYRLFLSGGKHLLEVEMNSKEEDPLAVVPELFLAMDKEMAKPVSYNGKVDLEITLPHKKEYKVNTAPLFTPEEEKAFRRGIGAQDAPIPGRFGFSKGDGVLDCAMPVLGFVDKLYLCGHPEYHKNFRWSYSLLPENAPFHGSYNPATVGVEKDDIKVDQLHVKWTADFDGVKFSSSYSLSSPAILTERSDNKMRLSNLEFAGNYQFALLPLAGGKKAKILPVKELPENLSLMGQNFILLFGSTEFPDLPLLLVFSKRPANMVVKYSAVTERLSEISMENCPLLFTATPCGMESFPPISPLNTELLQDLFERCCLWSRAFLAYPVKCREYFRDDPEKEEITILQKFEYRFIEDEWGTEPLPLAPLPPVVTLMDDVDMPGEDFQFPTKYGYFRGAFGRESSYTLPYIPRARLFPLQEKGSKIPALMEEGMKEYIDFQGQFPPSFLAYPYAGAVLEPYAYSLAMLPFCQKETQKKIREKLSERLPWTFRTDAAFDYTAIRHGYMMQTNPDDALLLEIYKDPTLLKYHLQNWFERKDPYTGASYHICYLNVGLFSSGVLKTGSQEEINALHTPFIENDWGAGLTYYYIYLSALASGNFAIVRKNMPLLKSAYKYFEVLHDWACMGTGYSDNAILWVEGANYGIFTSFINMAEAIEDKETLAQAQYMGAKQYGLRRAIIRFASQYLYKFYKVQPWYGIRLLCEENNPAWQFQNYQGTKDTLYKKRFRRSAIYSMTTEGIYPEFFRGLRLGNDLDAENFFRPAREQIHSGNINWPYRWGLVQGESSILTDLALREEISSKCLKKEIDFAKENDILMQEWRGIHIASRRLPKNYFEAQLLAWDAMKDHPLHLELWKDLYWEEGIWDPEKKEASIAVTVTGKAPWIKIGLRGKERVIKALYNGKEIPLGEIKKGRYGTWERFQLPAESGTLVLQFA